MNGCEAVNKVERAVISELKQQVQGKEGKFIKVGGSSRCSNNKHEAGKKHRSSEKSCIHQPTARSSPTKLTKSPVQSSSSSVTESSITRGTPGNGKPRGHHVSRSLSADPHDQERRMSAAWSHDDSSDADSWSSTAHRHQVRSPRREVLRQEARTPRSRSRDTLAPSQKIFSHHPGDNVWPESR